MDNIIDRLKQEFPDSPMSVQRTDDPSDFYTVVVTKELKIFMQHWLDEDDDWIATTFLNDKWHGYEASTFEEILQIVKDSLI